MHASYAAYFITFLKEYTSGNKYICNILNKKKYPRGTLSDYTGLATGGSPPCSYSGRYLASLPTMNQLQ